MSVTDQRVPMPFEWHPAYAHMTDLYQWLHSTDDTVRVPVLSAPQTALTVDMDEPPFFGASYTVRTLTKHKCKGGAPYVGRPFFYMWTVAVDDLGRAIATDSEIVYNPNDEYLARWEDLTQLPLARWL